MEPQARGPLEYPLARLTADQFESLVALLARTANPAVVPVRNKDHGLDARLPDHRGRTLHGWQAKRFTRGIHWGQCRESARRAIAFWRPLRITFVFAHNLSGIEQDQFRTELADHFPAVGFRFWPASEVQRLMRDTDEGRRAAGWLFSHPDADREAMQRALATGGELSSPLQAAQRQAVIQAFMDNDPHVLYTTVSRSREGRETPPAEGTFLSVWIQVGSQEVRFDASERYGGALEDLGAAPALLFSPDAAGHQARQVLERLSREGGRATISSGLGATIGRVPLGLRGLLPEKAVWNAMEVEARDVTTHSQPDPEPLTVLVSASGIELGMSLSSTDPPDGWDVMLAGASGGLELFQLGRVIAERRATLQLDWRYRPGEGTGLEQLLACQIMRAASTGAAVELRLPDGQFLLQGTFEPASLGYDVAELDDLISFLGFVTEAEAWLGVPLTPPAEPSEIDLRTLGWLLGYIRTPRQTATDFRATLRPTAPVPDESVAVVVRRPRYLQLFGQEIFAGTEQIAVPEARAIREDDGTWVLVQVEGSEPAQLALRPPNADGARREVEETPSKD